MISIIGAGPVGSYTAYLLARKGFDVKLFDASRKIGLPVQCTGLITNHLSDFIKPDNDFVVNRLDSVRVVAPSGSYAILNFKKKEFVVDRTSFDQHICNMAVDAGAELLTSHKFIGKKSSSIIIRSDRIKNIDASILIGADGPLSQVAKSEGLYQNRRFLIGTQAIVRMEQDANRYTTYFGKMYPGFFAWIVPESPKTARVGLATRNDPRTRMKYFLRKIGKPKVLQNQGGLIPIYSSRIKSQKGNTYLIGDAAAQVKATTGGGILPGFEAAEILAESITKGKKYDWKSRLGRDLAIHKFIRTRLDKFSDKDYDFLVGLLKRENVKSILEKYSREKPSRFIFRLLLKEPRFLYYIGKLF